MKFENILTERDGSAYVITLNRPKKKNAVSLATMGEIIAAMKEAEADDAVRAVILTGGTEFFSAGADLNDAIQVTSATKGVKYFNSWHHLNDTLEHLTKPIIAKVLAVPALRTKYLGYVREIAEKSLDWNAVRPIVKQYRDVIADDIARDTRKLFSTDDFFRTTADEPAPGTLRSFFEARRTFLLRWLEENAAAAAPQ